jgi:hypothetical protein
MNETKPAFAVFVVEWRSSILMWAIKGNNILLLEEAWKSCRKFIRQKFYRQWISHCEPIERQRHRSQSPHPQLGCRRTIPAKRNYGIIRLFT